LGARYLPEILVPENAYSETQIRWRTQPALDGTRYSPVQMQRGGTLMGEFKVDLGNTDTGDEMTGQDHDGLIKLLNQDRDMEGIAQVMRWADNSLLRPHLIKNELQRWQAIVLGQVTRNGSEGYTETVSYFQPAGHRPEVLGGTTGSPAGWYLDTYDPFDDIFAGKEKLASLGFEVSDIICNAKPMATLRGNATVATRTSMVRVNDSGQIRGTTGYVSNATINQVLADNDLPPVTVYNAGYQTPTGFLRFLDLSDTHDYFIMLGRTTRQWDLVTDFSTRAEPGSGTFDRDAIDPGSLTINSTLGYYGVGRNVGSSGSGRTIFTMTQDKKPKGYYGEAYQAGLPVVTEPEAIYVIRVKRPTAS
ncbi:MAG: major capsid protein, partial [Cyanobacteria bacterium P01_A01_bin.37]